MTQLELLHLADEAAYRLHFINTYCQKPVFSHWGFPVYFDVNRFEHAFFESSGRRGEKDVFSLERSRRIDWIGITLTDAGGEWLQGWDAKTKSYMPEQTVCFAHGIFVVVVRMGRNSRGMLKGRFITCYWADNSFNRIKSAPTWTPNMVPA